MKYVLKEVPILELRVTLKIYTGHGRGAPSGRSCRDRCALVARGAAECASILGRRFRSRMRLYSNIKTSAIH